MRAAATLLALVLAPAARAAAPPSLDAALAEARADLAAGQPKAALKVLKAADRGADELPAVVATRQLAGLPYLRGVALLALGDEDGAMDAWRAALVIDDGLPWDAELVPDTATRDLYLALVREVGSRAEVDAGVPEATGRARVFADGRRVRAGDAVREGRHLVQVRCPEGDVHGRWHAFEAGRATPDWLALCPNGVDTSVVVEEDTAPADDFAEFGPTFGPPAGGGTAPEPVAAPAGEDLAPAPAPGGADLATAPVPERHPWLLAGSAGAAAAAAGAAWAVALRNRAAFEDPDNPDVRDVADLEALRARTNTAATASAALGVAAAGLGAAAVLRW